MNPAASRFYEVNDDEDDGKSSIFKRALREGKSPTRPDPVRIRIGGISTGK